MVVRKQIAKKIIDNKGIALILTIQAHHTLGMGD